MWQLSHRYDQAARVLMDRHYTRQTPGAPQFASPGKLLVLRTAGADAVWVATWPRFAQHAWAGAWVCNAFRNEGDERSSELITLACAHTCWRFGSPPAAGLVTFVDPAKVRRKRDPGRCFKRAGFRQIACTVHSRLLVFALAPDEMPVAAPPVGAQLEMLRGAA